MPCHRAGATLFVFLMFDWLLSSLLGTLILFYISQMLRACKRIYKRFRLPIHTAVAGSFDADGSLGSGLREAQSSDSTRLEAMRRNKKWHEWPRRQYLYLRVFLEEFIGISSVVYEQRYRKQAAKGERAYNVSITNILRNLEYKARQEVSSTGARDAHGQPTGNRACTCRHDSLFCRRRDLRLDSRPLQAAHRVHLGHALAATGAPGLADSQRSATRGGEPLHAKPMSDAFRG